MSMNNEDIFYVILGNPNLQRKRLIPKKNTFEDSISARVQI